MLPRNEQETLITYDGDQRSWYFYSDNPTHCRKRLPVVKPSRTEEEDGRLIVLEGEIIGNVSISKKRQLTEEQKQATAERLKMARMQK